jgi:thioredoxin reductase (NADPH)
MPEVTVYGAPWCPESRRCKRLLGEVRVDYAWVDIEEDPDAETFVRRQDGGRLTLPVVAIAGGPVLVAPGRAELLATLGIDPPADRRFFDLIIAGAGPAGMSAALSAVREGISCLVIEQRPEPGGQAAETPHLHGFPGFPEGAAGSDVGQALRAQVHRYGVRLLLGRGLAGLRRSGEYLAATDSTGEQFSARAAIIATGATYGRLGVAGEDDLRGAGVHFCASCEGPFYRKAEELLVVGGGDLAGQEALFLTQFAGKVRVLERSGEFRASPLLLERLRRNPKIELYTSTEITRLAVDEDGKLTAALVRDRTTGYEFTFTPAAVFVYAGMNPNTELFEGILDLDEAGFIMVDEALQSSVPGVFAAGDVRAGSTKQLGSAVAEGLAAAMMVRRYLEGLGDIAGRASA